MAVLMALRIAGYGRSPVASAGEARSLGPGPLPLALHPWRRCLLGRALARIVAGRDVALLVAGRRIDHDVVPLGLGVVHRDRFLRQGVAAGVTREAVAADDHVVQL